MTGPVVRLGRDRRRAVLASVAPAAASAPAPDPLAWPAELEALAAQQRWSEHHRSVQVVHEVRASGEIAGPELVAALGAAGEQAAAAGARRVDLRLPADHPAVPWLARDGWVVGRLSPEEAAGDVVASRLLALPWAAPSLPLPRWADRLPISARRALRRARAIQPSHVPDLARELATEAAGLVRHRRPPPGVESRPRAGAPTGAHPFAATRFATIDEALDRVSPQLRESALLDIGAGDGRVLRHALDRGMARAIGRELDADLAARARAVAPAATVEVGDALAAPLPDDVGVVYLNNPFDAPLVDHLAVRLADALERRPRPLAVLYLNPPTIDPLVALGLVVVDVTPRLTVLVTRAPG